MHRLLERQLAKLGLGRDAPPDPALWRRFLERIDRAYTEADQDRYLIERSLAISSTEMQALYVDLRRSEERFRSLVQHASDVIVVLSGDGTVQYVSDSAERIFGYEPAAWINRDPFALVHPDDIDAIQAAFGRVISGPGTYPSIEFRLRHADGTWRHVEATANNLLHDPNVGGIVEALRDVTERTLAEAQAHQAHIRFRRLFEEAPVMYAITRTADGSPVIADCNALFARTLGYPREMLIGMPLADLYAPASRAEMLGGGYHRALTGQFAREERQLMLRDGRVIDTLLQAVPEVGPGGEVTGTRAMFVDITERKALEAQLHRQAFADPLTGLPNRALLMDRLGHALARAGQHHAAVAVLYLDLDNFKVVNDSLGHDAGDALLCATANRLLTSVRPSDTVARLGGDEFVILLEDIASADDAVHAARRTLDALAPPFPLHEPGREIYVTTSIGIATSTGGAGTVADLVRDADIAMYAAKRRGKAGYEVFTPDMYTQATKRLTLETDLRQALERDEFRVYFQPVVDLASGRIREVEALLRWQHPRHGLIAPADFIPIAEETGLIVPLGRWVLNEACRRTRAWHQEYPTAPPLTVSVNLSVRQFQDDGLVASVAEVLAQTALPPSCLRLEITESVMMHDGESARATLEALKRLGVLLAVDDFGTGYSSLAYLQRFPIDILKIDRTFVQRLGQPNGTALVRNIIDLSRTLKLNVTGEGIETIEQLTALRTLGCERGQGYYFERPVDAEKLETLLAAGCVYSVTEPRETVDSTAA